MSIRHLLAAAELQDLYPETVEHARVKLSPSHKWALAAIADDASDKTDQSFPGLEKVMRWSGTSKRRALDLIRDLTDAGLLEHVSAGYPGKRAVYRVHIPAALPEPVDNSPRMGAESAQYPRMGAVNPQKVQDSAPLSVNPLRSVNQSHTQPHLTGARVERGDDQDPPRAGGWAASRRQRKAEKHLDFAALETLVNDIYADFAAEHRPALIRNAALWIVGKAISSGSRLTDPTAYVASSIRNEPEVHRQRAFDQAVHL